MRVSRCDSVHLAVKSGVLMGGCEVRSNVVVRPHEDKPQLEQEHCTIRSLTMAITNDRLFAEPVRMGHSWWIEDLSIH